MTIATSELLFALAVFAFVSSITPGPNNLMLMASGANYGLRRTVPHMLGVSLGHGVMLVLVGVGLAQVFEAVPWAETALTVASVGYLLYLAWRIATAAPPEERQGGRPFTFLQAAAFQWVNPKAWTMALTAVTLYTPERTVAALLITALVFTSINFPCVSLWAWLGQAMRRVLTSRLRLRVFNGAMALLLVASLVPVIL